MTNDHLIRELRGRLKRSEAANDVLRERAEKLERQLKSAGRKIEEQQRVIDITRARMEARA